jgi:hypothetical protein
MPRPPPMFREQDSWDAWAAGRYLIGTVVVVVFGALPLFRGEWFGIVPVLGGAIYLVRTRQRHVRRRREVASWGRAGRQRQRSLEGETRDRSRVS